MVERHAVRFIGSQRFSITIENEVSTSSATADCVRVSVSEIFHVVDRDPHG